MVKKTGTNTAPKGCKSDNKKRKKAAGAKI
jgi:hypothetical protein